MQGILMILPQSNTFKLLKKRLDCVNITNYSLPFIGEEDEEEMSEQERTLQVKTCLATFNQQKIKYASYLESVLLNDNK